MTEQLRADGSLRHLLTLEGLPARADRSACSSARRASCARSAQRPAMQPALAGVTVANLFTEPSTRTRVSFELAAKRLGADVVNLEVQLSSRVKGESMLDTIYTLESLHVDVLRDPRRRSRACRARGRARRAARERAVRRRGARVAPDAGTARCAHHPPAQAALRRDCRSPSSATSAIRAWRAPPGRRSRTLGVADLRIVAPPALMPERGRVRRLRTRYTTSTRASQASDVIMMLRIQKERMRETDAARRRRSTSPRYGLTAAAPRAARSPDAIVMHPQPMNRGIEIASDVADGPQSVIRDQVRNGVAVRMAVLADGARLARSRAA